MGRSPQYELTPFHLRVRQPDGTSGEVSLHDIQIVEWQRSRLQRALRRADLIVRGSLARDPLVIVNVSTRTALRVVDQIVAGNPAVWLQPDLEDALMRRLERPVLAQTFRPAGSRALLIPPLVILGMLAIAIGLKGTDSPTPYPPDDAIAPGGVKRPTADIVAFMEREVMPWAREALAPLVGGEDKVRCETCHGRDGAAREWKMPGVSALPEPHVRTAGLELHPDTTDAWLRNAIYADLAEDANQFNARYMRNVVMPGMARLLRRAPYDFTKSYRENRANYAFGCYHCHRVQ